MTVRIGKVELKGVQDVYTVETRNLVEQRALDRKGGTFQDLGRQPVTVVMEGLLFGDHVLADLESLRQAHEKAEPLPFAADIAVGTELTDVIIEEATMRQVAGYVSRYRFSIRLREHVEPPESTQKAIATVNAAVAADADAWAQDAMAASTALDEPAGLAHALEDSPGLLNQMSAQELAGTVADNADQLSVHDVGGMLVAVCVLDPDKMGGMLMDLKDKGALGGLMEKFAAEGKDLNEVLGYMDPGQIKDMVNGFTKGAVFIRDIGSVTSRLTTVIEKLTGIRSHEGIKGIMKQSMAALQEVLDKSLGDLHKLVNDIYALITDKIVQSAVIDVAENLNCGKEIKTALQALAKGLGIIEQLLGRIARLSVQLSAVSILIGLMRPLLQGGAKLVEALDDQLSKINIQGASEINTPIKAAGTYLETLFKQGQATVDDILSAGQVFLENDFDIIASSIQHKIDLLCSAITEFQYELETPSGHLA